MRPAAPALARPRAASRVSCNRPRVLQRCPNRRRVDRRKVHEAAPGDTLLSSHETYNQRHSSQRPKDLCLPAPVRGCKLDVKSASDTRGVCVQEVEGDDLHPSCDSTPPVRWHARTHRQRDGPQAGTFRGSSSRIACAQCAWASCCQARQRRLAAQPRPGGVLQFKPPPAICDIPAVPGALRRAQARTQAFALELHIAGAFSSSHAVPSRGALAGERPADGEGVRHTNPCGNTEWVGPGRGALGGGGGSHRSGQLRWWCSQSLGVLVRGPQWWGLGV